jgi:hypothetical protein
VPSLLTDPEPDDAEVDVAPSAGLQIRAAGMSMTAGTRDTFRNFGQGRGERLDPETATRDYGVEGYLDFERPTYEDNAAIRQNAARRKAFRDELTARSDLNPLQQIGVAVAGALYDPLGLPLIFAPELLGLRGAMTARGALSAGGALAKAGRIGNAGRFGAIGAVEGFVGGGVYEAGRYALGADFGDDEERGQSLQALLLGTVLGGGIGSALGAVFPGPRAAPPRAVTALDDDGRLGAALAAIDDLTADRPVKVDVYTPPPEPPPRQSLPDLDDVDGGPRIAARELETAVAVTSRGREIPVRYALVELDDLVTSHDDDLIRNPAFPEALQPRDRTRAGSQAANIRLESELNPKRLMREAGAETGAPLVAPDGTVESGNGRTIALRRSARTGSGAYERYAAELAAQGFDTTGMTRPVLVRVRAERLDGEGRAALAREMNAAPTEAMGPSEQAMADALSLDDAMLGRLDGSPEGDRAFARAFIAKVAPDQQNSFVDADGRLSGPGAVRIKAALTARAYDDPRLIEAVFETADPNIRTLGQALSDAAPAWARMRGAANRGEIPTELDVTPQLRAAVDMIRHARDNKIPVDEWIANRLDQVDMFGGAGLDAETEAFVRLFFRDGTFKRHRGADKIAWALKDYARQASDVAPGPNLFGDTPDGEARLILEGLARKFAGDEQFPQQGDLEGLAPERTPQGTPQGTSGPAGLDLRADGGDGGGTGVQRDGGEGAQGVADPPARAPRPDPLDLIDPELRALAERELQDADLPAPAAGTRDDPATLAEALRAAAFCLKEGGA